jgi:hypothetical protein
VNKNLERLSVCHSLPLRRGLKALNMKIQTSQFVIPAKAGTQEKVEKKRLFHINWEKIVLFQRPDWVPAFAGMTTGGQPVNTLRRTHVNLNFYSKRLIMEMKK